MLTILSMLAILLIGQQTRLGARDAMIYQEINFGKIRKNGKAAENEKIITEMMRYGFLICTKCNIVSNNISTYPKVTYIVKRGKHPLKALKIPKTKGLKRIYLGFFTKKDIFAININVELKDIAMARKFSKILTDTGYQYEDININFNHVNFDAKNM